MRILCIHSDFIEYEPVSKAIRDAEEVKREKEKVLDCLVVFTAAEKEDESNPDAVAKGAVAEIQKVMDQVRTRKVVLYPFVHLTSKPAAPGAAQLIFGEIKKSLDAAGVKVYLAPFGWYKKFNIQCKGHPLAELSREIKPSEISEALKAEEKLESHWYILDVKGNLKPVSVREGAVVGFDFSKYENLKKFALHELAKSREVKEEPPHAKLMRELELVDYEPGSDPGNLRFYPKGRLVKSLLENYVTGEMIANGAMEIESPVMYDFEHPSLKKYMHRFPARQYVIETPNKKVFLRFAACFGQFLMAHDMTISYKNLPVWLYELTRYSFRVEKSGELAALRRLRAFTMPDCHALCTDLEQAKSELLKRFDISRKVQSKIGIPESDLELAVRMTKDFWDKNKDIAVAMVKKWGKPALIELWDKRFFYFILKYELNFVDALNKAAALTTDQIDIESAERYGIAFVDRDGQKKHPLILHLSPSGAIERVMYALLEAAYMDQKKGKAPALPIWLAPTQARLIPVSKDQLAYSRSLLDKFKNIRIDLDDRDETLGKKIRDAEKEWIPAIIVIGDKEKKAKNISVRFRGGRQKAMRPDQLVRWLEKNTAGMPFKPLPLPVLLSKRPVFFG